MVLLVSVDTSGELCSVALSQGGQLLEDTRKVERKHNEALLGMLDGIFRRAGVAPSEVDGVAFNAGPGSFTGGRLASAAAQAIGFAADGEVLAVRSSAILAEHAFAQGAHRVCTSVRSRAELYYLAQFEAGRGCLSGDVLHDAMPDWWQAGSSVVGVVPPWMVAEHTPVIADVAPARTLMHLALRAWRAGKFVSPELGLPVYVSGDDPWRGA